MQSHAVCLLDYPFHAFTTCNFWTCWLISAKLTEDYSCKKIWSSCKLMLVVLKKRKLLLVSREERKMKDVTSKEEKSVSVCTLRHQRIHPCGFLCNQIEFDMLLSERLTEGQTWLCISMEVWAGTSKNSASPILSFVPCIWIPCLLCIYTR